jgi:hypothetical protein
MNALIDNLLALAQEAAERMERESVAVPTIATACRAAGGFQTNLDN